MAMLVGRVQPANGARRSAWSLLALLYAIVLATGPLLHHDISCELKSRTHCTSCISGVSGPGLAQASGPPAPLLPAAGFTTVSCEPLLADACARALKGRSPPTV
jgi:hypothetical protein